ncbi:MAG: methyltransferase [Proteobacteria bacterium]|nr:methyltransferase [Pseudomonadota bacterium]
MDDEGLSEDSLLGGRLRLRQPGAGFRVAIDSVLLAAAVPAARGAHVLDAGAGVGGAALCLAARVPGCRVTGIEVDPALARLAGENAVLNRMADQVRVIAGDILAPPPGLDPASFDHVMANPPHLDPGAGRASPSRARAAASVEGRAGLADWVAFAMTMVRPKGSVTFVHRADRIAELVAALERARGAGAITVFPLWPRRGEAAKRVLVSARRGVRSRSRLAFGLVLHEAGGGFTAEAEAVLRDAAPLVL